MSALVRQTLSDKRQRGPITAPPMLSDDAQTVVLYPQPQSFNVAESMNGTKIANLNSLAASGVDGIAVASDIAYTHQQTYKYTNLISAQVTQAAIEAAYATFAAGITLTHNWLAWYKGAAPDFYDPDANWDAYNEQMRRIVGAAKNLGMRGIFFDTEQYPGVNMGWTDENGDPTNQFYGPYKSGNPFITPRVRTVKYRGNSNAAYMSKARDRGYALGQILVSEWADVQILHLHDMSYGLEWAEYDKIVNGYQGRDITLYYQEWSFGLAYFGGMMEAGVKIVFGGEQMYWLRTATEFANHNSFRKTDMVNPALYNAPSLTAGMRAAWPSKTKMSVGFMLNATRLNMELEPGSERTLNPGELQSTLTAALQDPAHDGPIWIYSETGTEANDWVGQTCSTGPGSCFPTYLPEIAAAKAAI